MKLKFWTSLMFSVLLLVMSSQISANASMRENVKGPRIDDLRLLVTPGGEQRWAMEYGRLDVATGVEYAPYIWALRADGFTETKAPSFRMFYLILNIRKESLDDVSFREAIAHLIPKERIVAGFGDTSVMKLDTFLTPAFVQWYNPNVQIYEYNLTEAERILDKAGYVYNATADRRMDPRTGKPLRDIKFLYLSGLSWPPLNEVSDVILESLGVAKIPATIKWLEVYDYYDEVLVGRNFDMTVLGFGLDNSHPDFLYDFFHSSQDMGGKFNLAGIHNSTLDEALETMRFSLNKTTVQSASDLAQLTLTEQLPYVPLYSPYQIHFFDADTLLEGSDTLVGMINSPGYGSNNQWTFLNIHWDDKPIGGNLTWSLDRKPYLHPLYASSYVDWNVLDRIYDPLIAENPYAHKDVPWLAYNWQVEPWNAPRKISGMKITFWLRDDVYWHDNKPFTAHDVKFSWEYIRQHQISDWYLSRQMWKNLVNVTVTNNHTISAYYNTTSLWTLYALSDTAAMLPKHIWQDIQDPATFEPWKEPHPSLPTDRPWLTKLVGTGPYVFETHGGWYVDLHANRRYFLSQKDIQDLIKPEATIDINPNVLNLKSKGKWITAYIELPEGYDVESIDVSTISLNDTVPASPGLPRSSIGDHDNDGIPDLMVKFSRNRVMSLILESVGTIERFAKVTLKITGKLIDGTPFEGTDTITVVKVDTYPI